MGASLCKESAVKEEEVVINDGIQDAGAEGVNAARSELKSNPGQRQ